MIKVGEKVPEFSNITAYQKGFEFPRKISFSDYNGKWLVLFFYPRDFTFICPTEIKQFSKMRKDFEALNCEILACSTDSEWSHKNWFERDLSEVQYPVLADTTQAISRSYDILGQDGAAQRGTFVVDPAGILRWVTVSDNSVGRSVKETLRAVQALQTGELCPVEWEPGEGFLKDN